MAIPFLTQTERMNLAHDARILALGGLLSASVALLHFAVIFVGAPAYRYLGAGERMAIMDERGDRRPAAMTAALTVVFAVWAAYAFSGAGLIQPLPFLRAGLVGIGAIYALRGLVLFPQLVMTLSGGSGAPPRHLFFSAVSLVIGMAYLVGVARIWRRLP
jgi:hypothetical protein